MDVEQINNYLSSSDKEEIQYSDAQWLYLQDNNNGQYNNYIQYITTTLKTQFIDYHNGYFWIPICVEVAIPGSTASPAAGGPPGPLSVRPPLLALRQSVLSMLGQLTVTTDQVL